MNESATRSPAGWSHWWHYDWGSWKSWRALLAHGAVIGVICGLAALVSNVVVGGLLEMEFGQDQAGGADAVALVVAVLLIGPMLLILARVLKRSSAPGDDPYPFGRGGFKWEVRESTVPFIWCLSAMAVFLGTYLGVDAILATGSTGRLAGVAGVMGIGMGSLCLRAGLDRLGAKRLPSAPVGR